MATRKRTAYASARPRGRAVLVRRIGQGILRKRTARKLTRRSFRGLPWRIAALMFLQVILWGWLLDTLFEVQIAQSAVYFAKAEKQFSEYRVVSPRRGEIFAVDREGSRYPLATSRSLFWLYAYPKQVKNRSEMLETLGQLAPLVEEGVVLEKKFDANSVVLLSKDIDYQTAEKISQLSLPGAYLEEHAHRVYPAERLAAKVIGFAAADDDGNVQGQYGVEKYFDKLLQGVPGFFDRSGTLKLSEDGADIVLTLDINIQREAERVLKEGIEKNKAEGGMVVVVNPKTGAILALAEEPGFNPNTYFEEKDYSRFLSAGLERYEPGSVMKPITYAAALDQRAIRPDDIYVDQERVVLNGHAIKNYDGKAHGTVTLAQALEKSYNLGAIHVQQQLGETKFLDYLEKFRFTKEPEIDFPGVKPGDLKNLYPPEGKPVNFATASFGQGIAVTPFHLISAFSGIANGGVMMRPYLAQQIAYADGKKRTISPIELGSAIKPETSRTMLGLLEGVVKNGSGKPAKIPGYRIAGKTGSAQIPFSDRRGYSDDLINTFIAFAPASDPQFLIYVRLNKPGIIGMRFAEVTVVPMWRELAQFIINYYQISPDNMDGVGERQKI